MRHAALQCSTSTCVSVRAAMQQCACWQRSSTRGWSPPSSSTSTRAPHAPAPRVISTARAALRRAPRPRKCHRHRIATRVDSSIAHANQRAPCRPVTRMPARCQPSPPAHRPTTTIVDSRLIARFSRYCARGRICAFGSPIRLSVPRASFLLSSLRPLRLCGRSSERFPRQKISSKNAFMSFHERLSASASYFSGMPNFSPFFVASGLVNPWSWPS